MDEIERERVFLLKRLPTDILNYKSVSIQIGDFTLSNAVDLLKIRRKGEKYELIKKEDIKDGTRHEHVIPLNKEEFELLFPVTVRKHSKLRVFYPLGSLMCEIDIYLDDMAGYARAEVEFDSDKTMNDFVAPDWFGDEITLLNHTIHEGLGTITFQTMVDRFKEKNISLNAVFLPTV